MGLAKMTTPTPLPPFSLPDKGQNGKDNHPHEGFPFKEIETSREARVR